MDKRTIVTIEDRIPKLKAQRKQKANRRLIVYLSLFFLLILAVMYFQSNLSHIRKITVHGNYFVSNAQIIKQSGMNLDTKFINVSPEDVASRLKKINEINDVHVTKHFYNEVDITVTEFKRVGYFKKGNAFYPMLQNGKMLAPISENERPVNAPIIVKWESPDLLEEMGQELCKVPEGVIHRISEISETATGKDPETITMFMTDGNEVITTLNGFSDHMKSYPLLVQQIKPGQKGIFYLELSSTFIPYSQPEKEKNG